MEHTSLKAYYLSQLGQLAQKANPATVRIYIALLSALFADLCERWIAQSNPARGLPRFRRWHGCC